MAPSKATEADEFVNIWMETQAETLDKENPTKDFYGQWVDQTSAKLSVPSITGADALRRIYPNHSLVLTQSWGMDILGFPGASVTPLEKTPLITNLVFIPLARSLGSVPGVLVDQVQFGAFKIIWQQYEYLAYLIQYPSGFGAVNQYFILHEGPEDVSRLFLLAAGAWTNELHDEIWVFNQGFWQKDHGLWVEVQKAAWKDVILKDAFKKALQKDVYGFFASEAIYKDLGITWKRGLIMHGPPGNGKTISLKTIMKTCSDKGFAPLYVKSFQSWMGEEGSMAAVFNKARELSPCVMVLEDLDSLINNQNRSFFLNQLDGLEGNDGLLIIGTTNHFDQLDPGLSTRPSRFDRKYKFDDPDQEERKQYAEYWQAKLASNKEINFPDRLVVEIAGMTARFSFAYLKEAFVSALVTLAGFEDEKPSFEHVLKEQIETLRKQLDKLSTANGIAHPSDAARNEPQRSYNPTGVPKHSSHPRNSEQDIRTLFDTLSSASTPRVGPANSRFYQTMQPTQQGETRRDIRALIDALSDSLASLDLPSVRAYEAAPFLRTHDNLPITDDDGRNFRSLLDRISTQRDRDFIADRFYTLFSQRSSDQGDWGSINSPAVAEAPVSAHPGSHFSPGPRTNAAPRFGTDLA
ncbi:hypothetical protein M413DRAFT_441472 [Hebeloma cylindrosporum]|uniref:ATPase AAA-type core domain-containing protein n=1 Tax=Hebeloma cylindrosporum TaxID=76867 RepID=A0A0C2YZH4_HEBCY|nr:hypothetical protein M413DRAFT_441472 [Hebeloma cylindrosporum h7]